MSSIDCAAALEAGAEAATLSVTKLPAVAVMVGVNVVTLATAALVAALNADVTVAILLHCEASAVRRREFQDLGVILGAESPAWPVLSD